MRGGGRRGGVRSSASRPVEHDGAQPAVVRLLRLDERFRPRICRCDAVVILAPHLAAERARPLRPSQHQPQEEAAEEGEGGSHSEAPSLSRMA